MHVLLIEPDCILAPAYRGALEVAGYSVDVVCSAQAAVHVADTHTPDVVVLELQLPAHNGVEFMYEFRSYTEWLHIPILVHSYIPPSEYEQAITLYKELGVRGLLHKPATSLRQLIAAVRSVQPVQAV